MFFYSESDSETSQIGGGSTDEHFDNVVLLMPMSTDFSDSSSHSHTVNTVGDASIVDSGGDFDGSGDYITVSSPELTISANEAVTIEFDLRFDARDSAGAALFDYGTHNSADDLTFLCQTDINGWQITPWMSNVYNWNGSTMVDGGWHHVAFTRTSDGSWYSFVDGSIVQSGTGATGAIASNGVLRINGLQNYAGYEFDGGMKNLRITKGVARYTSAFTPPTSHPEQGPPAPSDPNFSNVSLLLNMDSDFSDSSINNHTVTANGDATISSTESKYGGASGEFDGSGDYLTVGTSADCDTGGVFAMSEQFTVEMWINFSNVNGEQQIIENYNGASGPGWTIFKAGDSRGIALYVAGVGSIDTGVQPQANTWHHLSFCRDGTNGYMFLDGNLIGNLSSFGVSEYFQNQQPLHVARRNPGDGRDFWANAYIDDLRITKGIARYTANFTPPTEAHPTS